MGGRDHVGHPRVLFRAADSRLRLSAGIGRRASGRDRHAPVSHGVRDAASGEQHGPRPLVSLGRRRTSRAGRVVVLPQWNSDRGGHIGLSRLLARCGISALRLSLPYHDERMPPELTRADYIVSSNIARTVQVCRQAVLDTKRAIDWLVLQGYERIGILGTSLGSCLAMLTTAHEPRIRAQALNHVSPWFADVVWRGLSTRHVREGLNGHLELATAARAVAADQSVLLSRPGETRADAARLRALRSDVSGRSLANAGRGIS